MLAGWVHLVARMISCMRYASRQCSSLQPGFTLNAIFQTLFEEFSRCCVPLRTCSIVEHAPQMPPCVSCACWLLLLIILGACGRIDGWAKDEGHVEPTDAESQSPAP